MFVDTRAALRRHLAPLSPGHRRWTKFLAELPLDPDALERPLAATGSRDFVICGSPRTGTTLLAAALFQPPLAVTVMEPWDGMRLPPDQLFQSLRDEIDLTGRLTRGRLDVDALRAEGSVRWCSEGASTPSIQVPSDYLLGVKWPGWWRFLEFLPETRFLVCVRNPLEVVTSYRGAGGRVALGLQRETTFNRELNDTLIAATSDPVRRRVLLHDYVTTRILPFLGEPNVFVVRYERWFGDSDALLHEISAFLDADLTRAPVSIRPSASTRSATPEDVDAVRRWCRTAEALGYPVLASGAAT